MRDPSASTTSPRRQPTSRTGWIVLGLLCGALLVSSPGTAAEKKDNLDQTIRKINERLLRHWSKAGVKPAPRASDAEFLRRVYVDVAGRIPSVYESREFLNDKSPDKRHKLIRKLVESHRYVTQFTRIWRDWMLPEVNSNYQARFLAPQFEVWLRQQLMKNAAYDAMVKELLTVSFGPTPVASGISYSLGQTNIPPARTFYQGKEYQAETLAAATSRLFLGVRLECAQCHDHPFATWSREDFWQYAAFFAGIKSQGPNAVYQQGNEDLNVHELKIPDTEKTVQARFLDGAKPTLKKDVSPRHALAEWMTSPKNPYFARALVNRMWEYFIGTGFIEPIDEMVGADNKNHAPELLNDLAQAFIDSGYDLRFLIQAITGSEVYQLSTRVTDKAQLDRSLFARMSVRGLTGEQLLDSVAMATGYRDPNGNISVYYLGNNTPRGKFLEKFGTQSTKRSEVQTSILQALAMMNGQLTASATSLKNSETLAGILDSPFMDTKDRIEALYLAALARKPSEKETTRLVKYVTSGGSKADELKEPPKETDAAYQEALADVFWGLLNSSEFMFNH